MHAQAIELDSVPTLLESILPTLTSCQENTAALVALIPLNQFWRWKELWSNPLRNAIFVVALIQYLTDRTLVSLTKVEEIFGSSSNLFISIQG
jgi:hypothetical protein